MITVFDLTLTMISFINRNIHEMLVYIFFMLVIPAKEISLVYTYFEMEVPWR